MRRDASEVRLRHFDEITEDGIVADLERLDPSRSYLALLQLADPILTFARPAPQLVKIDIVCRPLHEKKNKRQRRIIDQRFCQLLLQRWHCFDLTLKTDW